MSMEFKNRKVWAPDPVEGFVLGRILDIGSNTVTVERMGTGSGKQKLLTVPYDSVFPAEDDDKRDVEDNCGLMYLNEGTLLHNVVIRYHKDLIYTYVANILIAINPYFSIPNLYTSETINKYQGKSLGVLPPHVFAIADKAFRDLRRAKESQSIIVSGESGAGKTESQKCILRYLCESWGSHAGPIEQRILESNPILESFGNATTMRNNNSSRFGKFVEIHFGNKYKVTGGFVSHYLLEKSRICRQQRGERNYHIFYQLCAGAPAPLRQQLRLQSPDHYNYLRFGCTQYFCSESSERTLDPGQLSDTQRKSGCLHDSVVDDVADFKRLDRSLGDIGMDDGERFALYAIVAGLLHLGNIQFTEDPEDTRGGCCLAVDSQGSLVMASGLLGVEQDELYAGLTSRVMQAKAGGNMGTIIRVPLKIQEAQNARDALTKAIYSRLFDYIVAQINQGIPFSSSDGYIGVLDIAGFEYFTVNSFEQFCINYCNEKLQQFFNDRILRQEQELYEREGLGVRKIEYIDNQDCIDLIESRGQGILDLLDEESKLPRPNHQHFTAAMHQYHKNHFRLAIPRKSKLREHRDIRDDEGFLIRHFAGAVCYQTALFIEKNNDALHDSLEFLIQESKSPLLRRLFQDSSDPADSKKKKGKLGFVSVGSKFRSQLKLLMDKLDSTGTHFVRCVKPNSTMARHKIEGASVLSQLQCSGMTSVLELMQQGYPSRTQFAELYQMYKSFMPASLARLEPRLFCKCLFKALGLDEKDFKFGITKVFFRPGKFAEFDQMLRADPENLTALVKKVRQWLMRIRWKQAQWCALSVIKLKNKIKWRREQLVKIQSGARGWAVRKKYKPKLRAMRKVNTLHKQLVAMSEIIGSLKTGRAEGIQRKQAIENDMQSLIFKIRDTKISEEEVDRKYMALVSATERNLTELRKEAVKEEAAEQERLRKLQEEMEREKRRKLDEEMATKQAEEAKRHKAEMEKQRREDEILHAVEMQKNQEVVEKQRKIMEEAERERIQQIEQERRDHELAMRLAQESNGVVEEIQMPPEVTNPFEEQSRSKYDLSKWAYADLRDVINTSNDIELLEACRDEFHRRLKSYHHWKNRNQRKSGGEDHQRGPDSIFNTPNGNTGTLGRNSLLAPSMGSRPQRYFRIPFSRPSDRHRDTASGAGQAENRKTGWWYAHFDGQWIARQMELHPDKVPVLLVAGRDDMDMCELSLDATGLTRKRGAEILSHQFDAEWTKYSGPQYSAANNKRIRGQLQK